MFEMTSAGSVTFALTASTDIILTYPTNSGLGSLSYSIDGGAPVTVSQNAAASLVAVHISGLSLAAHTITWTWVSGTAYVQGAYAYNAAIPAIDFLNGGCSTCTSTQYCASGAFGGAGSIKTLKPDLTTVLLGINDLNGAIATSTSLTNLTTIIANARLTGDALLLTPNPFNSTATPIQQEAYRDALFGLADSLACPLIDIYGLCTSYGSMVDFGRQYDTLHPNAAGYAFIWQFIGAHLAGLQ